MNVVSVRFENGNHFTLILVLVKKTTVEEGLTKKEEKYTSF